jgi:hypothetical protein
MFSVRIGLLCTENGELGVFKTGLLKIIKIDGMKLKNFRYPCGRFLPGLLRGQSFLPDGGFTENELKRIIERMTEAGNSLAIDIDFSNSTEVRIKDFCYQVFDDGRRYFFVKSKRAIISSKWPEVMLRGHVILTAADGSTLESNWVKWDTERDYFTVCAAYVLNRNGVEVKGKKICVDRSLNKAEKEYSKFEQKEEMKCFAKAQ